MENVLILEDDCLAGVDGSGWKASLAIAVATAICPPVGIGMAVGYYLS